MKFRGVDYHHAEGVSEDPKHLKDPKSKEWKEAASNLIESIVLLSLEDTIQEESRDPHTPKDYKHGNKDLSSIISLRQAEGEHSIQNEVSSSSKVSHFLAMKKRSMCEHQRLNLIDISDN